MRENRGGKSGPAVADLNAEHSELRCLGRELTDAVAADDRRAAAVRAGHLIRRFDPHAAAVESEIFPRLVTDHASQIADLVEEHRRIGSQLRQIADGRTHSWASLVEVTVAELDEHIVNEDDAVSPVS